MNRGVWIWLALLAGGGSVACGGDDPCLEEMTLRVGTGPTGFTPLAGGDPLPMVFGSQGGWHIDLSAEVTNSHQSVEVSAVVTVPSIDQQVAGDANTSYVGLVDYDDLACTGEVWSVRIFVDDFAPATNDRICMLHGQDAVFEVTVTDLESEQTVTESVDVRLQVSAESQSACSG
ncbi:MAG: hypothetical protein KTR31_13410 [Myxococcales bacterium]|nr:hypothetical protein [Myxococcales bacterium]